MTSDQSTRTNPDAGLDPLTVAIGASSRVPLLLLFTSAAIWAVLASVFALISSIKFHDPNFLAAHGWLTYGRVRPAYHNALIYGFCLQAALGVSVWLIARFGRTRVLWPVLATIGGAFWNLGVTVGVLSILAGQSTGFQFLEMPGFAAVPLFVGWMLIGVCALVTLHYRTQRGLSPSLWFVIAAFFWFPWIYSTAALLLFKYPVRGVAQAVIAWWYGQNLIEVCFDMFGLAAAFYFLARFSRQEGQNRPLALFAFWILIFFVSWGGIPNTAPVPAWMPAASTVSIVLGGVMLAAVGMGTYQMLGAFRLLHRDSPEISFIACGMLCFIGAGLMHIAESLLDPSQMLHFTWFLSARWQLQIYGFLGFVMFGSGYLVLSAIAPSARLSVARIRLQFWLSLLGVLLAVVPLAIGGVLQARQLANVQVPFQDIVKSGTHFLRMSTLGDLLLLVAHLIFLFNIIDVLRAVYRARIVPVYELATEDLFKAAGGKA